MFHPKNSGHEFQCSNCYMWFHKKWNTNQNLCLFCNETAYTKYKHLVLEIDPKIVIPSRESVISFTLQEKSMYMKKYGQHKFNELFLNCDIKKAKKDLKTQKSINNKSSRIYNGTQTHNMRNKSNFDKNDEFVNMFNKFDLTPKQLHFLTQNSHFSVDDQGFYLHSSNKKRFTFKELNNWIKDVKRY